MELLRKMLLYSVLSLVAVIMAGPFLWLLSTSLKSTGEIFAWPPSLFPAELKLANYPAAWNAVPFGTYFINSIIVTLTTVLLTVGFAALAAFPLARLNFPGRSIAVGMVLATLIIPQEVIVIPLYTTVLHLGLADTLAGVILPFSVSAFGVFLLRQAYLAIPRELEEAAAIDGASTIRIWWSILLPLVKPAAAALAILSFIGTWGDFLWPLIVLRSQEHYTLQVGLSTMIQSFAANYRLVAAGAVIATVPVIIVFLAMQNTFVRGILMGSGK